MRKHSKNKTALLLVDPYNDFMSKNGKTWPLVRQVTKKVDLTNQLEKLTSFSRSQGWSVFYAPHHQLRKDSFSDRKYLHPSQVLQKQFKTFSRDSFGSQFYPSLKPQSGDVIASEHDCSSGFMGTDLNEKLQERGISHLLIAGFLANTCIESTARSAIDLNYHVTLFSDGVGAWSTKDRDAAVEYTYPHLAHQLCSVDQFIQANQEVVRC